MSQKNWRWTKAHRIIANNIPSIMFTCEHTWILAATDVSREESEQKTFVLFFRSSCRCASRNEYNICLDLHCECIWKLQRICAIFVKKCAERDAFAHERSALVCAMLRGRRKSCRKNHSIWNELNICAYECSILFYFMIWRCFFNLLTWNFHKIFVRQTS